MPLLGAGNKAAKHAEETKASKEVDSLPPATGKTDLLLRFFDSQFFDEWIALTYLYKSTSPGVQDYLCNRLYTLPEAGLERYLSQLCQLLINQPHSSLERVIIDLCARSLRIAVKVCWLLLAIAQDHPKNTYVAGLRDQCERAALEGYWEPPFRDPKLLPMSPPRARWLVGSPMSPGRTPMSPGRTPLNTPANGSSSSKPRGPDLKRLNVGARFNSPEPFVSPSRMRPGEDIERPTSPDGLGGGIYSSYSLGQGLEGLICASPSAVREAIRGDNGANPLAADPKALSVDRRRKLKLELGNGEQVTALLDNSHRMAEGTLPADVLGLAAIGAGPGVSVPADPVDLTSPPSSPRLRQTTFGATLDFIEALCDASSGLTSFAPEDRQWALRKGLEEINKEIELASHMGVACWFPMGTRSERIVRLAAKEAVLLNSREKAPFMLMVEVLNAEGQASDDSDDEAGKRAGHRTGSSDERVASHATAGPGPGSLHAPAAVRQPAGSHASTPEPGSTPSPQASSGSDKRARGPFAGSRPSPQSSWRGGSFRRRDSQPKPFQPADDSFSRGLKTAMVGLQGAGPLVSLTLEVVNGDSAFPSASDPSSSSTVSSYVGSPASSSHDTYSSGMGRQPRRTVGPVIHEDDDVAFSPPRGMGLLCTWGVCRTKGDHLDRHWTRSGEPYVKVNLKVLGGVELRLNTKPAASHRRVPSDEAILRMAAQQRVRPPNPRDLVTAGSAPLLSPGDDRRLQQALPNGNAVSGNAVSGEPKAEAPAEPTPTQETSPAEEVPSPSTLAAKRQAEADAVFGERFWQKRQRIKGDSPHGRRPGWAVRQVIVKSGDDCRQELLAAQLVEAFYDIFQEAQLPLYLRPYEVLVTSSRTALIEMVPDTLSLHQIKAKWHLGSSLADFFFAKFEKGTVACEEAQRNFAESMAAYSIVAYLLQIKDRHNGNILLDDQGHLIHIDFGFMLSNSPGGVNFEAAPFKLTRELLEVLDSNSEGQASEMFDYFKVLCIQGFLACRKHADRIILLAEMMQNSGCPCFKAGPRAVAALRKRFHLTLPESQCVEVVLGMISDSLDAWRTRQYDYYQRVLNGIL